MTVGGAGMTVGGRGNDGEGDRGMAREGAPFEFPQGERRELGRLGEGRGFRGNDGRAGVLTRR